MAENSKIEWTHHTFNHVIGCTRVAEGCKACYAAEYAKRYNVAEWGPKGTRVKTSADYWKQPIKWNRKAAEAGERHRVFCASLADVFEDWRGNILNSRGESFWECINCDFISTYNPVKTLRAQGLEDACECAIGPNFAPLGIASVRKGLFALIDATPNLDWLLLTKRPENIWDMWPPEHYGPTCVKPVQSRENVWLLTSIATQADAAKNIPELLKCRDLSPVLGISAEPLIGPVDLRRWLDYLDWVIVGGESGHGARPCNIEWIRSIRDQCAAASVPVFVKQLGSNPQYTNHADTMQSYSLKDPKGGDWSEWPADLRIREFPEVNA